MALMNILHFPDVRLRNKATSVEVFDEALKALTDNMLETMYEYRGVGLAATQVNVSQRLFVLDVSDALNEPHVFINPEITHREGETKYTEGCLSIPGVFEDVRRAERIRVKAQDPTGAFFEMEASELLGVCIQHELDHLNGKLFIDHLSTLKRDRVLKKLKQLQHQTL